MPNYRRLRIAGGRYFFTVNLMQRRGPLRLTDHVDHLRQAVRQVRAARPFEIDAWVVLPDHLHAVWSLPADDDDFSTRWRLIKSAFSRALPKTETRVGCRAGERGVWQRRFWEHALRDDADYVAHVHYVHFNPVKHGLADTPDAWPYSTFRACVARGLYSPTWSGNEVRDLPAGEPDRHS